MPYIYEDETNCVCVNCWEEEIKNKNNYPFSFELSEISNRKSTVILLLYYITQSKRVIIRESAFCLVNQKFAWINADSNKNPNIDKKPKRFDLKVDDSPSLSWCQIK